MKERAMASACGKVILFGEHFVLWGGTAVAVPLPGVRVSAEILRTSGGTRVVSEVMEPETGAELVSRCLELVGEPGLEVEVRLGGNLPAGMGLGGSAATCVALMRSLRDLLELEPDEDLVSMGAFELEELFHGTPSGIDSTTIAFESPCFLKGGGDWAPWESGDEEPVAGFIDLAGDMPLVVAVSRTPGRTREAIAKLETLASTVKGMEMLRRFTGVAEGIAVRGASALRDGAWDAAGDLLNENHYLLSALGLSTPELEHLRQAALDAGAWGAKLTGGGLGGSLVALVPPDRLGSVKNALELAGAGMVFSLQ